jgi:hypothetical protein
VAAAFVSHPRRFLHAADEVPSEVVLTEKGINALWVGFAMNLLSTMYFIRASVHSHSKVRGREGRLSSALHSPTPHRTRRVRPTDLTPPLVLPRPRPPLRSRAVSTTTSRRSSRA